MSIYSDTKDALKSQLEAHFDTLNYPIEVHPLPYQDILNFPAISLELTGRRKPKRGVGVRQLEMTFNVWVYTNILDEEEAEEQCLEIVEMVEQAIELDKTLGGVSHYLSIDDEVEFGTVEQGQDFLQGARISLVVQKRVP